VSWRVETIPGIGVLGATAIVATAADPTSGRDFAAWIGLVPRQDSTGGKQKPRGRGRRRVFPRAADALDVGSISCVALIGRTSLREVLVISCRNRVAISYRDCDTIALDVRVVLLVSRAVHLRPDMLTPATAE
jgi:transposase